jgi:translation initiation factor 5A
LSHSLIIVKLLDIADDGFVSLMSEDGSETKADLKLPEGELGQKIREEFDKGIDLTVTVLASMDKEQIMEYKVSTK